MTHSRILKTTLAAAVASIAFTAPSFADVDGNNVASLLKEQVLLQGFELEVGSVIVEDDDVVLQNVELSIAEGDPITLDSFLLQNVSGNPDEGYVIERMALPPFTNSTDGITINFGGMTIDGFFLAGPAVTDPLLKAGYYRRATLGPISAGPGSNTLFSLSGGVVDVSEYRPGEVLEYDMSFNDMVINFANAPDRNARATMTALGYETLEGEITAKGSWDTTTGLMGLSPMTFSATDAADLSIDFSIGGYTPELVAALQEMQKNNQGNEQTMGMAMLGLFQQLDVRSIKISLDDNSLTGRLLDFFGSQQGMDRAGTVAFAKGMLPFGLAQIGNPEFAAKATAAIGEYLDDPQSLVIEAAPSSPVPATALMGAAMSNPGSLLDVLSVSISANQ